MNRLGVSEKKQIVTDSSQHCAGDVQELLLDCVQIISNLRAENMVFNKLVGRLDNPCLAVPLRDLLAGCDLEYPY